MPKAILEFNLPEESAEFRSAINGVKWECVIFELLSWLREQDEKVEVDKVFEEVNMLLDEENLEFDER